VLTDDIDLMREMYLSLTSPVSPLVSVMLHWRLRHCVTFDLAFR